MEDISVVEAQRALQTFYDLQEATHIPQRVSDVALLGSGFETEVFAFTLTGAGKDAPETRELVLRVYAGEGSAEKSEREFVTMRRLREAGYPVPQVLMRACDLSPFGRPFLIMERIHGVSMESAYWLASENQRRSLQNQFYELLAALHALDGSALLPESPLAGVQSPCAFMERECAFLSDMLSRLEGREPPSLREALAWFRAYRALVPCERLSVVHGDFHRNNVLLRADGSPCVIDWSNVRLADYRWDIAWTRLITRAEAQPGAGETELRLYAQLAGRDVENLAYFEALACARLLLSVLISLQFGAARQGMRPQAAALMRRDPGYTLYVAALLQQRTGIEMPDLEAALSDLLQ